MGGVGQKQGQGITVSFIFPYFSIVGQPTSMDQHTLPPHVLIFPLPAQGHVNSMLKLAELLCSVGIHVTFLVSFQNHTRLLRYTDVQSRFSPYSGFHFETLPESIFSGQVNSNDLVLKLIDSLKEIAKPFLKDFLSGRKSTSEGRRPVTCIIADGIYSFVLDVAEELAIPVISFRTISACAFWAYFCIPQLIEAGELPLTGEDMDVPISSVPGMESYLRHRDLPSFCRADLRDGTFQMVLNETQQTPRAQALILNTFEDLEGPILSQVRTKCPNLYTIGPLHAHLKARLPTKKTFSNSLWEEDESCLRWLDDQPLKSVIYVSFGSITTMTKDQHMEFWHGLVNSGKRFLWVIRPDSLASKELNREIWAELEAATKARGYIVAWTPQEEVLAHRAVGGFLTHCGWNSTLESVVEGVPMICWPFFADQQINSRFVGEVWKIGVDMKDICDRVVIEKMVRDLMEVRKDEFVEKTSEMANLARDSLRDGGTSYCNFDRLIKDIKLMVFP